MPPPTEPTLAITSDPRQVVTPLRVDAVERALLELGLTDQWTHVVHGLRHGFDVGVRDPVLSTLIFPNHASSALDAPFIDSYIAEEQAAGRYSVGFEPTDLERIIGPFRTAPLGLVPKPHSTKFRLVQDLSYPRNDVRRSHCSVVPCSM